MKSLTSNLKTNTAELLEVKLFYNGIWIIKELALCSLKRTKMILNETPYNEQLFQNYTDLWVLLFVKTIPLVMF